MKRLIFSALVLSGMTANAQVKNGMVGINTDEPRATAPSSAGGFFLFRVIEQCYLPASNSVIRSYRTALFGHIE